MLAVNAIIAKSIPRPCQRLMMRKKRRVTTVAERMRRIKDRDTAPELAFRRALWRRGIRYRLHVSGLPGKPDIVISSRRVAIFIDGDFWHGNQWRSRKLASLEEQFNDSNRGYWTRKIRRNMQRDLDSTAKLAQEGWRTLRFWESDLMHNLEESVDFASKVIADGAVEKRVDPI
ncbi:MAG: very short patch repair endonuclease, partial [Candidatus Promineifilaceae bacterium]